MSIPCPFNSLLDNDHRKEAKRRERITDRSRFGDRAGRPCIIFYILVHIPIHPTTCWRM
jgi:hypothetical protein